MKVEVLCCQGEPRRSGLNCLQERCPEYKSAKIAVDNYSPIPRTDCYYLYKGETGHKVNLKEVKRRVNRRPYDIYHGTGNPI